MKKRLVLIFKLLALTLGVYLLYKTSQFISWDDLLSLFKKGGLAFILVLFIFPISYAFHNFGLKRLFPKNTRKKINIWRLFHARFVGESINRITPFIDMGGEPLKIILIWKKGLAPLDESITAVCISRIIYVLTEIIFVFIGFGLLMFFDPSRTLVIGTIIAIAMSFVHLGLLVSAQAGGLIKAIPNISKWLGIETKEAQGENLWEKADKAMRSFYKNRKKDFAIAVFWQEIGWITVFFEIYFIFKILGVDITLTQAFVMQSTLEVIRTVSFYIPGNIGAQEGGLGYLASQLGFTATDGFAISLIKRFRLLVITGIGLGMWAMDRTYGKGRQVNG
jgi:uncharacterized protein (TIRG00374 family)